MIVAIVGSRDYNNYSEFKAYIDKFRERIQIDMIVSGGADGADSMAYEYARKHGITFICHPPKPEDGFPRAFFIRNVVVAQHGECMIAFPKGKSSGTRHAISAAKKFNRPCYVVEIKDE